MIRLPALCYRDALQPAANVRVLGTYDSDHSPAILQNSYGRGTAYYAGILAGLAYITPALPPSADVLPQGFPEEVRRWITLPATRAHVLRFVETSNPLVESQYLVGPNGAVVILVNWSEQPVRSLQVRFPGEPRTRRVKSLRAAGYFQGHLHEQSKGDLPVEMVNGIPQVTLPLEISDYLLID